MSKSVFRKYVEAVAAGTQFFLMTFLSILGPLFVLYVSFYTRYWYISVAYLTWIWLIDTRVSEEGGRPMNWIRGLKIFDFARDYFPVTVNLVPGFKLDPTKNYLFCYFPHGIMPNGAQIGLSSNACGIDALIPTHTIHPLTLHFNFKIPIFRDYLLSLGACSVTPKSVNWLLSYPDGGKVALIVIGGAAEAIHATPGVYKVVLKNRKGFVKLALKNGSPLVPVFSFGEVDSYRQYLTTEGSLIRRVQEWVKKRTGATILLFKGRGYYQNSWGCLPYRAPINVVIGKPIEVEQNINATQEDVDELHQKFMVQLNELFEEHKHRYIKNAANTRLIVM